MKKRTNDCIFWTAGIFFGSFLISFENLLWSAIGGLILGVIMATISDKIKIN